MAIELKETVGYVNFKVVNDNTITNLTESACATVPQQMISPDSLMVEIEGIHSNCLTVNDTYYTATCLEKSIPYWTYPYERPVIMHHKDQDGVTIGRIKSAEMVKAEKSRSNTPALSFTCNIGDENGIKGVNNGTLSTVSIGAMVYDLRCSICNKNLAEEGACEHNKGEYYDDKLCYWIIEDMMPKELSYVIVPSDKYAQTMKVYKPGKKQIKESVEVNDMSICDDLIKSITESIVEDDAEKVNVTEAEEQKEAAKVVDEEVVDKKEDEEKQEEPEQKEEKKDNDKEEDEKDKKDNEEDKDEEKDDDKEKKDEDDDKKEEDDSNKEDEDEKIKELEAKVADLMKEVSDLKAKLQKTKEAKESVELELAKYKVQEKVEVAGRIKQLKESVGISCEESEEMAKNYSIDELNLIYTNLKDVCAHTQQLPTKITQESLVDDETDNLNKVKNVKESVDYEEDFSDFIEFQNLRNKLFK